MRRSIVLGSILAAVVLLTTGCTSNEEKWAKEEAERQALLGMGSKVDDAVAAVQSSYDKIQSVSDIEAERDRINENFANAKTQEEREYWIEQLRLLNERIDSMLKD